MRRGHGPPGLTGAPILPLGVSLALLLLCLPASLADIAPAPSPTAVLSPPSPLSDLTIPPPPGEDTSYVPDAEIPPPPPPPIEVVEDDYAPGPQGDLYQGAPGPEGSKVYRFRGHDFTAWEVIGIAFACVCGLAAIVTCIWVLRARQRNIHRAKYGNTGAGAGNVQLY
eukprot:TRINITY_DN7868_c0_g1_i1.p1 TRINITY_DN7868_c0_g1~~TRINITY_DN7868_c0_g1_i1.p1  ORF type:complete len:168 (+),score=15.18 TRINITY_DN7868_c0_g1_i1:137-640(+)